MVSMRSDVVETIVVVAVVIYVARTLLFLYGMLRERRNNRQQHQRAARPRVSVVIPARNEEEHIEQCVRSVFANTYAGALEVIVVNDRSTDRTAAILQQLQREFPALIVHNTVEDTSNSMLRGKPRALHQGIGVATGEVVMMTDADCTVQQQWVERIAAGFGNPEVGLVASFTVMEPHSLFEKMQTLEWVFNHTLASAGVGLQQPVGCFGNNLSIRRSVYDELGGYAAIPFSVTEDLALLQAVAHTRWKVRYPCWYEARVVTLPVRSFGSFIRQHQRWAKGGQALGWRATIFVLSSAALWLGVLASLVTGYWEGLALLVFGRIIADALILVPSLRIFRMAQLAVYLPIAVLFFMCIEFVIPFFLLKKQVVWKGQSF